MHSDQQTKAVATVTEIARRVGLSRARFYQLMREGVFPQPSRNPKTKRPFFDQAQQEQCLLVRKTNCGINGKPILFYACRPRQPDAKLTQKNGKVKSNNRSRAKQHSRAKHDPVIAELRSGLKQLGADEVSDADLRAAIADEFPDGAQDVPAAQRLMTVFRRLKCRDSHDNVT